ncbi:hypothetical protein NECAME_01650 [Necator americanus]|uniref:ZP domain-containing protein n=1 Tax=Necator americanus TaxID=51031 RepID=W2TRX0_NECAM|nr:hypothetical protein NECAME_01650 [Necator americanus]ETN84424.1 hypothetical protein NECAME_01650 [Necator americanus]
MDRAFHIRCFFLESVKNLHTEFSVGTLKTEVVEQEFQLPECIYQLRDGINGPTLQYAQVGQRVTHRWSCEDGSSWVYGILIHSCFADDGQGNKFELVDDRGCSTDSYLLPQIGYEPNSLSAFTNAQVFKYADKVQLYFTCTVQLCYKHDGGCEGVTPPVCDHDSNYLPGVTPPHHDIDSPSIGPTFDIPFPRGSLYSRNHFEKDYLLHKIAIYLGGEGEPEENAMYNEFPPESKPFFGPIDPMDGYGR